MGLRAISFASRGGLGQFRNSSKQNQNYLERFWPSVPTGGLLVTLGIEHGGNYSPQLGPWTKSLLNSRQLQKLDVEYEKLIVPQLFKNCIPGWVLECVFCSFWFFPVASAYLHIGC